MSATKYMLYKIQQYSVQLLPNSKDGANQDLYLNHTHSRFALVRQLLTGPRVRRVEQMGNMDITRLSPMDVKNTTCIATKGNIAHDSFNTMYCDDELRSRLEDQQRIRLTLVTNQCKARSPLREIQQRPMVAVGER
uniref:DNA-directed RNA polymerase n=1 Tax=Heterorhabditis bacteriophora TaxID=37862 RepID=A0A1I7XTI8_HETBA